MALHTLERRIGVIGLGNAGKTVFLTSLINHLERHAAQRFPIVPDPRATTVISRFARVPPDRWEEMRVGAIADGPWQEFPYSEFRSSLLNGHWPAKTGALMRYICEYRRSDDIRLPVGGFITGRRLKFYDFPGERLADACMWEQDYKTWSDFVLAQLKAHQPELSREFLELQEQPGATAAELLKCYKLCMARRISNYHPFVTPSTFTFDAAGDQIAPEATDEAVVARYCGLPDAEFVPLGSKARSKHAAVAQEFRQHYDAYQAAIAKPLVDALYGCDAIAVLVDVPALLSGGSSMVDQSVEMIENLIDAIGHGKRLHERLIAPVLPAGLRPGGIEKIVFVATKIDRVLQQNRDNVLHLLEDLFHKSHKDFLTKVAFKTCSAVHCTMERDGFLFGRLGPDRTPTKWKPSLVPREWPHKFVPGQFLFQEPWPEIPESRLSPPRHIELDHVFRLLLGEEA